MVSRSNSQSAASTVANIAEIRERENANDFIRFLEIVQDSLKELEMHMVVAWKVKNLPGQQRRSLMEQRDEIVGRSIH